MTTGILIVAHAPLASALASVGRHVDTCCSAAIEGVDVPADADADTVIRQIDTARARLGTAQTLLLVDAAGATPWNLAVRAARGPDVRVVAGVSVPMLWRCMCYAHEDVDALVERALQAVVAGAIAQESAANLPPLRCETDPR